MSDDLSKKGSADRSRININETHEAAYWTEKFGITKEQLKAAIDKAGSNWADAVEKVIKSS